MAPKSVSPCAFYDGNCYEVSEAVGHMLAQLMMSMRREVDSRMAQYDLTDAQWKPLWMLKSGRAGTAFEMARELGLDAGAMTRTLDRLAAKGLIERTPSTTDRRVTHLRLTEAGEVASARIPHVLAAVNNEFLQGFTEKELAQFKKLIQRMAANGQALQSAEPEEQQS